MSFSDDLKATSTDRPSQDVEIALAGNLHTLRFTAVDGLTWANLCDNHPMRPGITLDGAYGYDLRSLAVEAAPLCGSLIEGDGTVTVSDEDWAELFSKMDGQTFRRISDVLWGLNELIPQEAVAAAKKALAASKTPSTSRSRSASPRGASSVGNRKKPPVTSTTPKVA